MSWEEFKNDTNEHIKEKNKGTIRKNQNCLTGDEKMLIFDYFKKKMKSDKKAEPKPQVQKQNAETVAPVTRRISNPARNATVEMMREQAVYKYTLHMVDDLILDKSLMDYTHLPWMFCVAANLASFVMKRGDTLSNIYIGGGSTEVSHTGTVAYSHSYSNLERFVQECESDMDKAATDARMEYGSWFSSLDYSFIRISAEKYSIEVDTFLGNRIYVKVPLGEDCDLKVLTDFIQKYGVKDFTRGILKDEVYWDALLQRLRRRFQLEETRTYFLSSFMDTSGKIVKYSFDIEKDHDVHYEILEENMEQLNQILLEKLEIKYPKHPASVFVMYLEAFGVSELICMLKKYTSQIFSF